MYGEGVGTGKGEGTRAGRPWYGDQTHGRDAHATAGIHDLPWDSPRSRDRLIANEEIPFLFSNAP
jgi:hypothetical protein